MISMCLQANALSIAPTYGPHAARLAPIDARGGVLPGGYSPDSDTDADEGRASFAAPSARAHTMFAWHDAVSPHIAVATEGSWLCNADWACELLMQGRNAFISIAQSVPVSVVLSYQHCIAGHGVSDGAVQAAVAWELAHFHSRLPKVKFQRSESAMLLQVPCLATKSTFGRI